MAEPTLQQMIRWREQYVSSALNRKFFGLITPGVYKGFYLEKSEQPRHVAVTHGLDAHSVAAVERDGYNITVSMSDTGEVAIPAPGTWFICIEAYYVPSAQGYQRIVAREKYESHHVVLGTVVMDSDGNITITNAARKVATIPTMADVDSLWAEINGIAGRARAAWTQDTEIASGETLTLPSDVTYIPGRSIVFLSWDGLVCHRGQQFEEVAAASGSESSNQLKMLFDVPADSEFEVVVEGGTAASINMNGDNSMSITGRLKAIENAIAGIEKDVRDTEGSAIDKATDAKKTVDDLADRVAYVK